MTGYLTGYMYGKLINATHLELIVGGWLEYKTEAIVVYTGLATPLTDRPSWV